MSPFIVIIHKCHLIRGKRLSHRAPRKGQLLPPYTKLNSRIIKDLDTRGKNIKILKEIVKYLHDLGVGEHFFFKILFIYS